MEENESERGKGSMCQAPYFSMKSNKQVFKSLKRILHVGTMKYLVPI